MKEASYLWIFAFLVEWNYRNRAECRNCRDMTAKPYEEDDSLGM